MLHGDKNIFELMIHSVNHSFIQQHESVTHVMVGAVGSNGKWEMNKTHSFHEETQSCPFLKNFLNNHGSMKTLQLILLNCLKIRQGFVLWFR